MEPLAVDRPARPRTLILVWVTLVALALLSAYAAHLELGGYAAAVALTVATVKAALVVWFFMGLRSEGSPFRVLFGLSLVLVVLILGATFLDLAYR